MLRHELPRGRGASSANRPAALMTLTAFIRDSGDFESAFVSTFGISTYDFAGKLYVEIDRRYKTAGNDPQRRSVLARRLALLFVAVYLVKRVRSRRKLERWERRGGARDGASGIDGERARARLYCHRSLLFREGLFFSGGLVLTGKAADLKSAGGSAHGGSNPSPSAKIDLM